MRHQNKVKRLGKPQDQRKALLRSLATSLFMHGEINITMTRAKVLKSYAEKLITFAKKGDVHSRRQAAKFIFDQGIEGCVCANGEEFTASKDDESKCECGGKAVQATVLRKLFSEIGPKYKDRNGGYTRILRTGHRRGDNTEMALIQLT